MKKERHKEEDQLELARQKAENRAVLVETLFLGFVIYDLILGLSAILTTGMYYNNPQTYQAECSGATLKKIDILFPAHIIGCYLNTKF